MSKIKKQLCSIPTENELEIDTFTKYIDTQHTTQGAVMNLLINDYFKAKVDTSGLKEAVVIKVIAEPNFFDYSTKYELTSKEFLKPKNSSEKIPSISEQRYKVLLKNSLGKIDLIPEDATELIKFPDYTIANTLKSAIIRVGSVVQVDVKTRTIFSVFEIPPLDISDLFTTRAIKTNFNGPNSGSQNLSNFSGSVPTGFTPPAQREEDLPDNKDKKWTPPLNGNYIISSLAGPRINPVTGKSETHGAIDIKAVIGTPIYAVADGYVSAAYTTLDDNPCGLFVALQIKDNGRIFRIVHCHMSEVKVKIGQKVNKGDIIGLVGSTGRSTGPHLHFQIKEKNILVDPFKIDKIKEIFPEEKLGNANFVASVGTPNTD